MRRAFNYLITLTLVFAFSASIGQVVEAKQWNIPLLTVDYYINQDSTVWVNEEITFNFDGAFTYVVRDIPHKRFGYLSRIAVLDAEGNPASFETWEANQTTYIQLNIDHVDEHATYHIQYLVHEGVGYFPTHDEWYFNVDPLERSVDILEATARVHLPPNSNLQLHDIKQTYHSNADRVYQNFIDDTFLFTAQGLSPSQHLTIVAGFPKGIVDYVLSKKLLFRLFLWILILLVPLFYIGYFFHQWWNHGRNKQHMGVIVPQYRPFESLTPAESEAILHDRLSSKGVIAAIIDLAERGYLSVKELTVDGLILDSKDYLLTKLKPFADLPPFEHQLLSKVFERKKTVELSKLSHKLHPHLPTLSKIVGESLVKKGLYKKSPHIVRIESMMRFGLIASTYFAVSILLSFVSTDPLAFFLWISSVIVYIFASVFAVLMPTTTPRGSMAYEYTQGFRDYLQTAERFRLEDVSPDLFSKLLSYAIAFHVSTQWLKRFDHILTEPPSWMTTQNAHFSTKQFTNAMNSFNNGFERAFSSQSSASSSSGFSGGSIGGGGGGGGISAG